MRADLDCRADDPQQHRSTARGDPSTAGAVIEPVPPGMRVLVPGGVDADAGTLDARRDADPAYRGRQRGHKAAG